MKRNAIILLLFALALFSTACKSRYEILLSGNDAVAKYNEGMKLYKEGKYKKSAAMFESLSMLSANMAFDDTVRYYWGLSNYKFKDYITAEANFSSFCELYPNNVFTPEAKFLKLDCMYRGTHRYELDQNPTRLTIVALSEYILENKSGKYVEVCQKMLKDLNNRLDIKAYENARLYYKMEDYIAAKTALKNILKENSENIYREQILYYIVKSDYKYAYNSVTSKQKDRYLTFVDSYYLFTGELPDSQYRRELDLLYARAQRIISGESVNLSRKTLRQERREENKIEKTSEKPKNEKWLRHKSHKKADNS